MMDIHFWTSANCYKLSALTVAIATDTFETQVKLPDIDGPEHCFHTH